MTASEKIAELKELGYRPLHTSYFRGYVSRVTGPVTRPYKGKFGEGYVLLSPNWESSQYSFVTYFVK